MARRKTVFTIIIATAGLLAGCSGSGSYYSSVSYGGYYDPYPYWGRGGGTVIVNPPGEPDRPGKPERPEKPPVSKPPISRPSGGVGRPGVSRRR